MRTGAGLWVRAELRRRWRPLAALTVLCAVVVTVVLAAVAGARRTTTSYDRYLEEARASHVDVLLMTGFQGRGDVDLGNGRTADDVVAELRRLPGVEAVDRFVALQLAPEELGDFITSVALDGYAVNRPRIVDGRLPRGTEEAAISASAAEALSKGVGDVVELVGYSPRQGERFFVEGDPTVLQEPRAGPRVELRVVGVVDAPGDIGRVDLSGPYAVVAPELYARHRDDVAQFGPGAAVRLRRGFAGLPALRTEVLRLVGDSAEVSVDDKRTDVAAVDDALDVQALALLLFAGVAAAAGLAAVGTATSRQLSASSGDARVLAALGLTRRQRATALATLASPVVVGGVAGGLAGAFAASPLLPIGLGGQAEPDPGLAFDARVLPAGALALLAVLGAVVAAAAWRATGTTVAGRRDPATAGGGRAVGRWISRTGAGAVTATGLGLAFDPGPRSAPAPVRAALAAAVLSTAGVAAVLVFGASLENVVARPELSGFPWHGASTAGETLDDAAGTIAAVIADPAVDAVTVGELATAAVAGEPTQVLGTRAAKGSAGLTVLEGRAPAGPDEAAVGARTRSRLADPDVLELATEGGGTRRYRVVGTAAFPVLNVTTYDDGVWLTLGGREGAEVTRGNAVVLVRLARGADTAARLAQLEEMGFDLDRRVPAEVGNLDEARGFPQALAAFFGVLGVVTVGHALAISPRRRRREFAVLRTLGFVRWQVRATLAVQATAVVVTGLVVGLPLGTAAGRAVWGGLASSLSIARRPVVPPAVLLAVPAALVLANLLAVLPGRRAAAVQPAEILRAE